MKCKKLFWVIFSVAVLVLQQTQVSAKALPAINLSKNQVVSLPQTRTIAMYELNGDNSPSTRPCFYGDTAYGCAEYTSWGYPYRDPTITVDVEKDYLLDVLTREMDVHTNSPTLEALKAQAIAARSYADFRFRKMGYMDNSTDFQIFIPYAFEFYTGGTSYLNDELDPCNEDYANPADDPNPNNLNATQQLICDAVTSTHGYYLSQDGLAIDAQFGSDSIDRTATCVNEDGTPCRNADSSAEIDYLIEVPDPISAQGVPGCAATNNGNASAGPDEGKVWGMSQKGAIRWSKGNHCAENGDQPWPVKWIDYKQILAHYYTGIDIVNAAGNPIAPDDR